MSSNERGGGRKFLPFFSSSAAACLPGLISGLKDVGGGGVGENHFRSSSGVWGGRDLELNFSAICRPLPPPSPPFPPLKRRRTKLRNCIASHPLRLPNPPSPSPPFLSENRPWKKGFPSPPKKRLIWLLVHVPEVDIFPTKSKKVVFFFFVTEIDGHI